MLPALPQALPSLIALPGLQTYPEPHDSVPLMQVFPFGVHGALLVHATQLPVLPHTPPALPVVVHDVPASTNDVPSTQVATPPSHDVVPWWHGLAPGPFGEQLAFGRHALQSPP